MTMATYRDVASECGISMRTVSRVVSDLQGKGIIKREGAKKKGKWKVIG